MTIPLSQRLSSFETKGDRNIWHSLRIVFLASEVTSFITGEAIGVTGGIKVPGSDPEHDPPENVAGPELLKNLVDVFKWPWLHPVRYEVIISRGESDI